jgi:hypothetical protein
MISDEFKKTSRLKTNYLITGVSYKKTEFIN